MIAPRTVGASGLCDACDEGGACVDYVRVWCVVLGNASEDVGIGASELVADEGPLLTIKASLVG